jgi:hypothetical protein
MALRASELTDEIEAAFADEWARLKAIPLPGAGAEERRMLFAAVARGVLAYLDRKDDEIFRSITLGRTGGDTTTWDIVDTDLDVASG